MKHGSHEIPVFASSRQLQRPQQSAALGFTVSIGRKSHDVLLPRRLNNQ